MYSNIYTLFWSRVSTIVQSSDGRRSYLFENYIQYNWESHLNVKLYLIHDLFLSEASFTLFLFDIFSLIFNLILRCFCIM